MKNLQDIINHNREQFDKLEPSDGHFKRFQDKLNKRSKTKPGFNWMVVLKAASVAILVVLSSLWVYDNLYESPKQEKLAMQSLSPETRETQMYYATLVDQKYEQIKSFDFEDEKQKRMLLRELREMNETYENIQEDIKSNPNDPRVINALIKHYQMKLDVMNQILNQLKNLNQNNEEPNHETTEI
ncbi:MAG: hypothetical protein ACLFUW_05250 [Bacteroidales bacterium]